MPQYQLDLIFEDSAIQMQAQANKDINTEKLGLRVSWEIFYTEKKAEVGRLPTSPRFFFVRGGVI